jgi:hypothetical protein
LSTLPAFGLVLGGNISNGSFGTVIFGGQIPDLNTSAFSEGDLLYISEVTAGALTATAPTGANFVQAIGVAVKTSVANGTIQLFSNLSSPAAAADLSAIKAIVSDSALLVVTTGTNTVTLSPDTTPSFTSVEATTITGTTIQVGGTISTHTGTFSHSLTVSGLPVSVGGGGSGINNVVEDTTPQLGGNLDTNTFSIVGDSIVLTTGGIVSLFSESVRIQLSAPTVTGSEYRTGGTVRGNTGNFKNLAGMKESITLSMPTTVTGVIVLEEYALYPYSIANARGSTLGGTISGTLKVNDFFVGGIENTTWDINQAIRTATTFNTVAIGDKITLVSSGTSNFISAGITIETVRL